MKSFGAAISRIPQNLEPPKQGRLTMDENKFVVRRLANQPGKFLVTRWPSSYPPSGSVPREPRELSSWDQTFRGTEEETRQYLADKGLSPLQIQTLIDGARNSPEMNAPEYVS